jgi:hypothetical protein
MQAGFDIFFQIIAFFADSVGMKRNLVLYFALLLIGTSLMYGADLTIGEEDIRVTPEYNATGLTSGYHLFVRKKPDVESVMLTESTHDPSSVETNYAYRARDWNPINGNELRLLDGKLLNDVNSRYSIIDSTPELDSQFGSAFHLYVPREMIYGYPGTRNGIVEIEQDTFINIRAFGAKYGDYTGGFEDNPFAFDFVIVEVPASPPAVITPPQETAPVIPQSITTENYNQDAVTVFRAITQYNRGDLFYTSGPAQLTDDIVQSVHSIPDKTLADIVFVIDATGSMKSTMSHLRRELKDSLKAEFTRFGPVRLGLVFYRDYGSSGRNADNFTFVGLPLKAFPFTTDLEEFNRSLDSFVSTGTEGGDRPEAIYEALYVALDSYDWNPNASRKIILVGDAEPHPTPRGDQRYSKETVEQLARSYNVIIDAILLPEEQGVSAQ